MPLLLLQIALVLLLGLTITVVAAVAVWWWLLGRPPVVPGAPVDFTVENRYRLLTIALTVAGGVGGVTALVIAYRKQLLGEAEHAREDTKLFTERYARVAEQLGSDKAAVRLAGVYAMADLADDWQSRRQVCIDVFCGYLRLPYRPPDGAGSAEDERAALEERQVRHTVIRLVRDHLRPGAEVGWNGHDFDFTAAVFDGGDFGGAVFGGGAVSFRSARFVGGDVSFRDVVFAEGAEVSFDGAVFDGAEVSLDGAAFAGGQVSLRAADFLSGTVDLSKALRWQPPPELDPERAGPVLVLPPFGRLLRAVLDRRPVVRAGGSKRARREAALRRTHGMPDREDLIGYLENGHVPIAFTDRRVHVTPTLKIPYSEVAEVTFTWHSETVGSGTDQGPSTDTITYIRIHHRDVEERLYQHGDVVVELVRAIRRLPRP
ncbi:pentapeptide repeat protein [Saccharothrix texasensis]|uniref:Pentapeptide repeat protein n=2 Tax=Saccharothrix texasensis TaxID=103734 RepID=A0A3N1GXZ7_9PSEU|nr:pentapeptide repeat protein [Saccharothrix texasensis]